MIDMFGNIAAVSGPITPDLLAAGLQQAMYTTAFGLMIAIPALAASRLWDLGTLPIKTRVCFESCQFTADGLHLL